MREHAGWALPDLPIGEPWTFRPRAVARTSVAPLLSISLPGLGDTVRGRTFVGDVGGGKTLLQISEIRNGLYTVWFEKRYPTRTGPSFPELASEFLALAGEWADPVVQCCVGVTGVVSGNRVMVSRIADWLGDPESAAERLGMQRVRYVNDLQALAAGLRAVGNETWLYLQGARRHAGRWLVISAGSGLGQSVVLDQTFDALPSEAGQSPFAPQGREQIELWEYLFERHGHVTWEDVLARRGLMDLYDFLRDPQPGLRPGRTLPVAVDRDPVAILAARAKADPGGPEARAIGLFLEILGQYAAGLVITFMAEGGVLLSGGVVQHLLGEPGSQLGTSFLRGFRRAGNLTCLSSRVPVAVAVDPNASLIGATLLSVDRQSRPAEPSCSVLFRDAQGETSTEHAGSEFGHWSSKV